MKVICTKLLLLFIPFTFFGQVIKLDSTFSGDGFDSSRLFSQGTVIKNPSDNKYLVYSYNGSGILKYNLNGTLDSTFNNSGYLSPVNAQQYYPSLYPTFDDQNNFIFFADSSLGGTEKMVFQRVKQNGRPDSTFGINSILIVPNSNQRNGNIFQFADKSFLAVKLVYVTTNGVSYPHIRLSKFKKNYTIDSTFGINGSITHPTNYLTTIPYRKNIKILNTGHILMGITNTTISIPGGAYDYDISFHKFKPNGFYDSTFGVNGIANPKYEDSTIEIVYSTQIMDDGKILAFGQYSDKNYDYGAVYKFLPNGKIDTAFAAFGRFLTGYSTNLNSGTFQKDGKIICVGSFLGFNVERIREDGFPDMQFGTTNSIYMSPFAMINNQPMAAYPYESILENDTALIASGEFRGQFSGFYVIATAKYRLKFQPYVTGVKTNYCIGTNGTGTIINLPIAGSDTIVKIFYGAINLSVSPSGVFSFSNSVLGQHTILVQFIKGNNIWQETIKINVRNLPIADAGPDIGICSGSATLGAQPVANTFYQWTSSSPGYISNIPNPKVWPTVSTVYYLKASNGGCISRDTMVVNLGTLTANAGPDKTICTGSTTSIGSSPVIGNIYNWVSIPAGFTSSVANPNISPTTNTAYILTVISGTCTGKDTVSINVTSSPIANAGPDKNICFGYSSTTIGTPATFGHTYSWLPTTGLNNATIAEPITTPNTNTTYIVTVTNTAGCKSSDNVNITLIPRFVINLPDTLITLCLGKSVAIGVISQSGYNYNWSSVPSGFSSTLSNPTVSPTVNTRYILTQTNTNTSCSETASVNVIVDVTCRNSLTVFPNPSKGNIVIQLTANNVEAVVLELTDATGRSTYIKEINTTISLTISNIPSGIYSYTLRKKSNGEILKSGKLLIQK
jgi:Secretion system C-terminal sorting domain